MIDGISVKPSNIQRRHKYIQNKGIQKGYNSSLERRLRRRRGISFPRGDASGRRGAHSMPESARALWRIVSFTAAKTRRMFDVSVACVRLGNRIISVITSKMHLPFIWSLVYPTIAEMSILHCKHACIQPLKLEKEEVLLTEDRDSDAPCSLD